MRDTNTHTVTDDFTGYVAGKSLLLLGKYYNVGDLVDVGNLQPRKISQLLDQHKLIPVRTPTT